jgi:hypothetical protein
LREVEECSPAIDYFAGGLEYKGDQYALDRISVETKSVETKKARPFWKGRALLSIFYIKNREECATSRTS